MSKEKKELNEEELNSVAGGKGYEMDAEYVINGQTNQLKKTKDTKNNE